MNSILPLPTNFASPSRPAGEASLRNRIAARMLLAGLLPVAGSSLLRLYWEDLLGLPEDYLSYQVLVASMVLIFSALLAAYFSKGMILLLRGVDAGEALAETLPSRVEQVPTKSDREGTTAAFGALLASGSDAVLLVDHRAGEVLGTSRRFLELFGGDDEPCYSEVKTRLAARFAEPERFEELWTRLAGSGLRAKGEHWRTAGPESRELVLFSEPLPGEDETAECGATRLWVFVDITEEIALRAELARAQRLESIGALAGGVAHDFNNMLTGVMGNLALAEIDAGDTGESIHLDRAKAAGMRAVELARHLIGFSRASDGRARPVVIEEVVREVEELVRPALDPVLRFGVKIRPDTGSILGESAEIEQVLVALCLDARKALKGRKDGEITLLARISGSDAGSVELVVRDNRDDDFPPPSSTSEEIARRHGGTLSRGRADDGFWTVVLALPTLSSDADDSPTTASSADARLDFAPRRQGGETILMVDDEDVVRQVGEKMLRHRGYAVIGAADGHAALERYDEAPDEIDLVLLDLTMPRLSGAATFRMLKERNATLPVIVCSGYQIDADTFEAENGWRPDGIIAKPFSLDGLSGEVRRVLDAQAEVVLDA